MLSDGPLCHKANRPLPPRRLAAPGDGARATRRADAPALNAWRSVQRLDLGDLHGGYLLGVVSGSFRQGAAGVQAVAKLTPGIFSSRIRQAKPISQ